MFLGSELGFTGVEGSWVKLLRLRGLRAKSFMARLVGEESTELKL